jgi:hypothetical protein
MIRGIISAKASFPVKFHNYCVATVCGAACPRSHEKPIDVHEK